MNSVPQEKRAFILYSKIRHKIAKKQQENSLGVVSPNPRNFGTLLKSMGYY